MLGLKIFVRVQTFRRVPPVLPCNFCHPAISYFPLHFKSQDHIRRSSSSPSCTGSSPSACKEGAQPCCSHPATSRPALRHRPATEAFLYIIYHIIGKKKHIRRLSLEIWIVLDAISIRGTHDSSPEWNLGEIGQSVSHFLVKPCLDRR